MSVSDFASKGVLPSAASVTLGLPKKLTRKECVLEIADGLNAGAREYGCYVIGGGTAEAADLVICVFLFGIARQGSMMLRHGTRAGDVLAVTGLFGKSAAGIRLLSGGYKAPEGMRNVLVDSVLMPKARLREGLALRGFDYVSASIDSRDGLAHCLHELTRVNKIGFLIEKLPVADEAEEFAAENGLDAFDLALYGREEYELVLTISPQKWEEAKATVQAVGGCLIPIGHATYEKQIIYEVSGERRVIKERNQ
jgi:thiamine-monophosphate kinase